MDDKFDGAITTLMRPAAALPIVAANSQASQRIAAAITDVCRLRQIGLSDVKLSVEYVDGKLSAVQEALALAKVNSQTLR